MIDAPGPWGTGPYTLVEGFSSLENEIGLIQAEPLVCVWLDRGTPRSERVVLEANRDHWNVDLSLIPADRLLAAQHALVEKVFPLPFDVLVHAWIDLSSDAPPAFVHSQFFAGTGAFRAGPPISGFDDLLGRFAVATDQRVVTELTTDLDRFAYDQALSVFLCAPQALYAVNRHVAFDGYAATFELAETQVAPEHCSRR